MAALTSIGTDRSAGSILPNGLTASPDSLSVVCSLCGSCHAQICVLAVLSPQPLLMANGAVWASVQVMSNPALTSFKGLDALQQLGGGLLVVNNTALTSLDGLGALGALNATGAASVSLPKVCSIPPERVCAASGGRPPGTAACRVRW